MADIFVSYARQNATQAREIQGELERVGYSVWMDDELPVHRAYAEVIEEQIREVAAVLVIWSEDALKSKWVRAEAELGLGHDKLVQVSLDGTLPPIPFNQMECAMLTDGALTTQSPGWQKLMDGLEAIRHSERVSSGPRLRQITVMSCRIDVDPDVARDPETMHSLIPRTRDRVSEIVEAHNGYLASRIGQNIVAYFGYPSGLEFAAGNAVQAGLTIADTVRGHTGDLQVAFRIGVHTGSAVISPDTNEVVGDLPDVATSLQAAAAPNSVCVSEPVRNLLAGAVETVPLAEAFRDESQRAYRVVPTTRGTISDRFGQSDASRFVGRQEELQMLLGRWSKVREGMGQVVVLLGEPGIGKSRLIREFRSAIQADNHVWVQAGGDPLHVSSPFFAAQQLVANREDSSPRWMAEGMGELRRALEEAGSDLSHETLGLDGRRDQRSPKEKRDRVLNASLDWVFSTPADTPLLLVIEDLHWLDPSTTELIQLVAEQGATVPVFLVCTTRAEGRPTWPSRHHHLQINMDRLSESETLDLIGSCGGSDALEQTVMAAIVDRAGGVPLFVEELTRLLIERGEAVQSDIPFTLQDSLQARLDSLGPVASQLAQLGAVVGKRFSYELIHALSNMREAAVRSGLVALADADLLQVRGRIPDIEYEFKHALIKDVAYNSFLTEQRKDIHARVAEWLIAKDPLLEAEHPDVLAVHWAGAQQHDKAVTAWKQAARLAVVRHAYQEAEQNYRAALQHVEKLDDSSERDAMKLRLQNALVAAMQITHGYSADVTQAATRASSQLAEVGDDRAAQYKHLHEAWAAASSAGEYLISKGVAERLLSLAQLIGRPRELAGAYMALVTTLFRTGDLAGAERAFSEAKPFFAAPEFARLGGAIAQSYGNAAINALIMGLEVETLERLNVISQRADTSENPYDAAFLLHMSGRVHLMLANREEAQARALRCIEISTEQGYPQFAATGSVVLGRAKAELGMLDEGLTLIQDGLEQLRKTGNRAALTHYMNWLAQTHEERGELPDALSCIDEALTVNPNEICYRPESFSIKAAISMKMDDLAAARDNVQAAIVLADQIGAARYLEEARKLELRLTN